MEIPDVIVVNKADHPMTDTMVREVRGVLALSHDRRAGRCRSCAPRRRVARGSTELVEEIDEHRAHIEAEGTLEQRRARNLRNEVLGIAASRMRRRLEATAPSDPETAELLERVVRRELDPASAAASCWSGKPMAELRCLAPDPERGACLGGPSGRRGRRHRGRPGQGRFVDGDSGEPAWLVARLGRRRARGRRGPASRLRRRALRRLGCPRGRGDLRSAPVVDPTRPLLPRARADDLRPLDIGETVGRAAAVAGRPEGGGVTAVPSV